EDPYKAIRQACFVKIDTESEPSEDPIDTETPNSPHAVASPTLLPGSTLPTCHTEESEDSVMSDARSTSLDSTTPLSPDHPLTRTLPTPTLTRDSFQRRTARITMHAQPVMSPSHSSIVAEAMALSDSALCKRYRSSYVTSSSPSSLALPVRKRYQDTSDLILDSDSEEDWIGKEDTDEDEGHGLDDEGHGLDDEGHSLDDEGYGLDDEGRSMESDGLGLEGKEEVVPKVEEDQIDLENDMAYIDIPSYPPPAPPAQTPTLPEWSFGSLPVSRVPSVVPSPVSSPMISLTVLSPTSSLVATPTATIPVDEDQFIEIEAQLELFKGIL
ncbi:hypothetical protein Tco_1558799, partial [Tanacetum coccineum]